VSRDQQVWLIILGVDVFGGDRTEIQLTADINGTQFVYPTLAGVLWLEAGPTMAAQQFALPPPADYGYKLQFTMQMRRSEFRKNVRTLKSVESLFINRIPAEKIYNLHVVEEGARAPGVGAVVRFRLSTDPNAR
jgi:hypothetical protein